MFKTLLCKNIVENYIGEKNTALNRQCFRNYRKNILVNKCDTSGKKREHATVINFWTTTGKLHQLDRGKTSMAYRVIIATTNPKNESSLLITQKYSTLLYAALTNNYTLLLTIQYKQIPLPSLKKFINFITNVKNCCK